jgi:hypothetical protein
MVRRNNAVLSDILRYKPAEIPDMNAMRIGIRGLIRIGCNKQESRYPAHRAGYLDSKEVSITLARLEPAYKTGLTACILVV